MKRVAYMCSMWVWSKLKLGSWEAHLLNSQTQGENQVWVSALCQIIYINTREFKEKKDTQHINHPKTFLRFDFMFSWHAVWFPLWFSGHLMENGLTCLFGSFFCAVRLASNLVYTPLAQWSWMGKRKREDPRDFSLQTLNVKWNSQKHSNWSRLNIHSSTWCIAHAANEQVGYWLWVIAFLWFVYQMLRTQPTLPNIVGVIYVSENVCWKFRRILFCLHKCYFFKIWEMIQRKR